MNKEQWKKELGLRKLERLAKFLKTLPKKKFDYSVIGLCDTKIAKKVKTAQCCTVACALGWTTVLWPKKMKMYIPYINKKDSITGTSVCYNNDTGCFDYDAGAQLFNIERDESKYLFSPWNSDNNLNVESTNIQVANHILKFVKQKRKELKNNV